MSEPDAFAILERALDRARAAGADAADAVLVEGESWEARVRNRETDFVTQAREHELSIRAFVTSPEGVRCAATSTSDLSGDAVEIMAAEAARLAGATAADPAAGLPEAGFAQAADDLSLLDPRDRDFDRDRRIEEARRAEAAARATDPRIVNSEGSQVTSELGRLTLVNTAGFRGSYAWGTHGLFCEPLAEADGSKQRDFWVTVARRLADLEDPETVGRRAAERAVRRLGARSVPTCEVPVVFEPRVARSLLGHLVTCVQGSAVYREASFLAGELGRDIAAPHVTVMDDGRLPGGLGSRPFDADGLPTRRTAVVRAGRLESYLLDTYSARKLGLASTGNARRGAGGTTTPAPNNLWLEPGAGDLESIVRQTDRGLLVTELIGMGFNPVTGDYSRGAAGLWIEGGEIVHPVEEVTIAGHLGEMLRAIDLVGSDLLWTGPIAAPTVRVACMTVAGR